MTWSRCSNCITEEATEMPRCFSISIQSEVAWRPLLRALTVPAIWIAPENSSSFSVSVVLPASGWEMMPKVRRRCTSRAIRAGVLSLAALIAASLLSGVVFSVSLAIVATINGPAKNLQFYRLLPLPCQLFAIALQGAAPSADAPPLLFPFDTAPAHPMGIGRLGFLQRDGLGFAGGQGGNHLELPVGQA